MTEEATGLDRTTLMLQGHRPVGTTAAERLAGFVVRRLAREPVYRLLGRRSFYGLDLAITPAVLDPRPDTETVVEAALREYGGRRGEALSIVDLGTGSGAILCALLAGLPAAIGIGVDLSPGACVVARHNLEILGLASRAVIVRSRWAEAVGRGVDLVVSNPPYIETGAMAGLDPEVRDHDPVLALDGGPDGLAAYRDIIPALPRMLVSGGVAVLEIGWTQADGVASMMQAHGLRAIEVRRDLGGRPRAVLARH